MIPRRLASSLAALVLVIGGCGALTTTPPPPGPEDFPGIARRLAAREVMVAHIVSGDSGCEDREVGRTAIRFDATWTGQDEPVPMYLYIFRNREAWERNREVVRSCSLTYVDDPAATRPIEVSPYILVTPAALPPGFESALTEALEEAAGIGG